jgi:hypothetical protein
MAFCHVLSWWLFVIVAFYHEFLGMGERAGSEASISGMSDFGFFLRFGLGGMNGWELLDCDWLGRS